MVFTKEAGRTLIEMWPSYTTEEITKEIGCNIHNVYGWTRDLREAGFDLPPKTRMNAAYKKRYIEELKAEMEAGKIKPRKAK